MTKSEILKTSLEFKDPGIVPYNITFTKKSYEKLASYYKTDDVYALIDNYLAVTSAIAPDYWAEVRRDYFKDEFGVIWNRTVDKDIGIVDNCIFPGPNLKGCKFPDPYKQERYAHFPSFLEKNRDKFIVCEIGFSLFERAWTMRGMENLLMDMIENHGFVEDLLDAILDFNLKIIKEVVKNYDIDAFMFGDDWGCQRGLIMGPDRWRTFLKPRLSRMYGEVRRAGKKVFIHSCGMVQEIFPDLIEIGVNVFNPFQPEVMDIFEMKKKYYGKLAYYGGISIQKLLPYGTVAEVRAGVKNILKEIGRGGGYIASPSHGVPGDVPLENLVAMIEVIKNQ